MPDLYLHPSVTSYITDQSQVFQTAAGLTTLFCPFFSEKGRDGVLQVVDGPDDDDFVDKFGDPNSTKFGQAHLNILEWIKAGGTVVGMRCLPDDAEYAHAILDFQTKDVTVLKWQLQYSDPNVDPVDIYKAEDDSGGYYFAALDADGLEIVLADYDQIQEWYDDGTVENDDEVISQIQGAYGTGGYGQGTYGGYDFACAEVEETRVLVRPRFKKVVGAATTESAIQTYAESLDGELTDDGFKHHVIGYFRADGRGADYYNELEFKLTANDALDDTYQFRVFDLEVYHQQAGSNVVVEGPFQVTFDETALDNSGESMFISNVLERYGKGTTFVLMEDGYESLCEELNSAVDPALQDPFFLSERNLYSGETDIHGLNVLSSGQTTFLLDVDNGDDKCFVDEPELLFPGGTVVCDGLNELSIADNSGGGKGINVTTGRVDFEAEIFPDYVKDVTHLWIGTPAVETAIAGVGYPVTGIEKITVDSVLNSSGSAAFEIGECILVIDGDESANTIAAIDMVAKTLTLGTPIDLASQPLAFEVKQVRYDAGDVIAEYPLPEYNQSSAASASADEDFEAADELDDDFAGGDMQYLQLITGGAEKFVVGGSVVLTLTHNGSADTTVEAEIEEIDTDENWIKLAETVTVDAGVAGVFTPSVTVRQTFDTDSDGSADMDFDESVSFAGGSVGSLEDADGNIDRTVADALLVQAYSGAVNEEILQKKLWPVDMVLDANYSKAVKDACNDFVSVIRQDCVFCADLGFTANPQQALDMRSTLNYSTFFTSMFSQDASVYDEYIGRNVKVTVPYFIAGKVPVVDRNYGIHWPFVGPRRGVITGFENLSWNPTDQWQERLYRRQVNYVKKDPRRTMLYGQLTSQTVTSALSDLNHVRALLRMQREVEEMMEDYNFEFISDQTLKSMNYNLNSYLKKWRDNGCCSSISGTVYSSDYDRKQKIARVRIEMVFTAVLERIIINFVVK